MANFSGMNLAIFLGTISPMIMIIRVITMEETVTPCAPNKLVNKTVARDADTTLTIVLPINMVVKSFEKFSVSS